MVVTRTLSLDDLTPKEMAAIFAPMDSVGQAQFFNAVATATKYWPGTGWCGQCAYIIDDLSDEGARAVLTLAGHIQDKAGAAVNPKLDRVIKASVNLGRWMSAALEDPKVCEAMKADILEWFSAGEPVAEWRGGAEELPVAEPLRLARMSDSDGSGEAGETPLGGSTEGDSAGRNGIAQTPPEES